MFFRIFLSCWFALMAMFLPNESQFSTTVNDEFASENQIISFAVNPSSSIEMNIESVSTLNNGEEYLAEDSGKYSGLINSTLRIKWKINSTNFTPSLSINNYYAKIIDSNFEAVEGETSGFYDVELIGKGETMLMVSALDANGNTLSFDNISLRIYDKIEKIELSTISNSYYLNKNLQIKVTINDDKLLFAPNLKLFYLDGEEKVMLLNALDKNNYFNVTIDSQLNKLDKISFVVELGEEKSQPIEFVKKDVTFISYFDVVDTNQFYILNEDIVSFFVRIPLKSNPEFVLNNKSGSIELIKYQVSEDLDTYSVVEFKIKLLKSVIDDEVILGSLTYDANGVNNRGYNYKSFRLSIIDEVTSIGIKSSSVGESIDYGETVAYSTIINDFENVDCAVKWYLDDELVQEGGQFKCQYFQSGKHILKIKYGELEASQDIIVAYSTKSTIIWTVSFLVLIIVVAVLMIAFSKIKKKQSELLLPYVKPMKKFDDMFKSFVEKPSVNAVNNLVKELKNLITQLGIYDISDESVSFEAIVDNCRKLLKGLQNYKTAGEDKKQDIVDSLDKKWANIFRAIQDFNAIIIRKEGVQ